MDNDGFEVVRGKKATKRRNIKPNVNYDTRCNDTPVSETNMETIISRISDCRFELEGSEFLVKFRELLKVRQLQHDDKTQEDIVTDMPEDQQMTAASSHTHQRANSSAVTQQVAAEELVCYGIGSLVSNVIARYQYTLFTLLREDFKLPPSSCYVYDPVLSGADKQILTSDGLHILDINEEGKRAVTRPTVFYMPHCGKALYNNLLWSNWCPERLQCLTILGNSFDHIETSTPRRFLEEEGHYILKILPYMIETRVENIFHHTDVFNDLSLHTVDMDRLKSVENTFWTECPEPTYQHGAADIILNEKQTL